MGTFLFDDVIFGPVNSRRFGVSLGINLLPEGYKCCTFNCIYCECGWTFKSNAENVKLPKRSLVSENLGIRLQEMKKQGIVPDNITYAGNGEPTIHPEFAGIIDDTIKLRNQYFPKAEITVLTNSSMLHKKSVFDALNKVDNNVLKLDTVIEDTFMKLNQPVPNISLENIIADLKRFTGNHIIQTLFIRGNYNGNRIDNATQPELDAWLNVIKDIQPKYVMIYPIARDTPAKDLEKISKSELRKIEGLVNAVGIKTKVYY
ncbi:MAG: radical SAM protein [Bacteroidales bacterium]|nr:radical SAM protein [Bacteroidales bacterium]